MIKKSAFIAVLKKYQKMVLKTKNRCICAKIVGPHPIGSLYECVIA